MKTTIPKLREEICTTIAKFGEGAELEEIRLSLEPYFNDATSYEDCEKPSGISPLMVACDKGNIPCLKYLETKDSENKTFSKLIGNPLEQSIDDQNSAMHFAAMSGNADAIDILARLVGNPLDLGCARNANLDSPLMISAVYGNNSFLQRWIDLAQEEEGPEDVKKVLGAKNLSGDTCITLACCHGHPEFLEILISVGVSIDHPQVETCRSSLKRMEAVLCNNISLLEEHQDKLEAVRKSVARLEGELSKMAEEAASQLLVEAPESAENKSSKKNKKKKRKARAGNTETKKGETESTIPSHILDSDEANSLKLTQLANGTVGVSVPGKYEELSTTSTPILGCPNAPAQSADELFRQRFEGNSSDLEAVMDSLCLDVSQLLFTAHGMALNLSPSQLDAVHNILRKQIAAVEEAREIQRRLHNTSKESVPGGADAT